MQTIYTREEMYDLVWSVPMRLLAKRFGISDVALRKRCLKAAVPTPPAGYWTQLRAGQGPARPPLPPRPLGMSCVVGPAEHRDLASSSIDADIEKRMVLDADWSAERLRKRLREQFIEHLVDAGGKTHSLIWARLQLDDILRAKAEERGYELPFDGPIFDSPFERRRLRLLNTLFLICEAAGAKPDLTGRRANEISVTINHVTLDLLLAEDWEIKHGHNAYPLELPRGAAPLTLAILNGGCGTRWHRSWRDAKGKKLETWLPVIAAELFVHADERYREKLNRDNIHRVDRRLAHMREAERRAQEVERQRRARAEAAEQEQVARLLAEARAHHDAQLVRAYVDHLRASSRRQKKAAFEQWADWAVSVADNRIEVSEY